MAARFGESNVFMDVDMEPGVDFVERITEAVGACRVLIIVIGPRWATLEDEQGRARLADPDDFVRLEVETALRRPDVTPIPVLVAGARMPNREDLPAELRPITRRNALELSDQRWRYDVGRLISTLDGLLERVSPAGPAPPESARQTAPTPVASDTSPARAPGRRRAARRWGARPVLFGALALAAIVVAVVVAAGGDGGEGAQGEATDYRALLDLLPADIRPSCKEARGADEWMVESGQATAQALCGDQREYYLTYGLWPSPLDAQDWVGNARDADTRDCETSTTHAMKSTLPRGTTGCEDTVRGDDQGISMWWSGDGSRVGAWFSWPNRDQQAALQQWKRLVKA
jgi:hypothetical protein